MRRRKETGQGDGGQLEGAAALTLLGAERVAVDGLDVDAVRPPLARLDGLVQHLDVPAERHGGARHAALRLAGAAPIDHFGDEQLPVADAQEDLLELAGAEEAAALPPELDLARPSASLRHDEA